MSDAAGSEPMQVSLDGDAFAEALPAVRTVQELGGSSVAAILPRDVADHWELEQGDQLLIRPTEDGIELCPCEPE